MITREIALVRLNEEKNYEDKLAYELSQYFINSLEEIKDITYEERKKISDYLNVIMNDSLRHSAMFNELHQMVYDNETNNI